MRESRPPRQRPSSVPTSDPKLGTRIEEVASEYESRKSAAEAMGVSTDQLQRYIRGENVPPVTAIAALARGAGFTVEWLATGEEPKKRSAISQIRLARDAVVKFALRRSTVSDAEYHSMFQVAFDRQLDIDGLEREFGAEFKITDPLQASQPRPGFVYLPLRDVEAAAGNGALIDSERVVDVLAFKEEWIRQELHARPDDLDLIYVKGDSMEPDLRAGDIILLDHTDTRASREGVYVIKMDGALLVKQLQRLPGGVVKVISRNPAYEPFNVTVATIEGPNGFAVLGRVVWACRRF